VPAAVGDEGANAISRGEGGSQNSEQGNLVECHWRSPRKKQTPNATRILSPIGDSPMARLHDAASPAFDGVHYRDDRNSLPRRSNTCQSRREGGGIKNNYSHVILRSLFVRAVD
jgi:hypothetical protein